MTSPSVAVFTLDPATRRQAARTLISGGMEVRFHERAQELASPTHPRPPHLLLLDVDTLPEDELGATLEHVRSRRSGELPVVLLSLGEDKSRLSTLLQRFELGHLVAKHGAIRAVHPVLDERELLVTCHKALCKDVFGIEKYVGAWGTALHRTQLRSMEDKYRVLSEFEGFLTDLECPRQVVPDILTVADEFMLNAVVHAPRDEQGKPRYEHLEPDPKLQLSPNEYVDVAYACDGQRLMLSVADPFGALRRETIQAYVSKGFSPEKRRVEDKASGAGLGLSMAFLNIHQLIFNVHEGKRTEAIAGWYLRVNTASEFRRVSKSLNLFWLPNEAPLTHTAATTPPELPPLQPSLSPGVVLERLKGRVDEAAQLSLPPHVKKLDLRQVTGFSSRGVVLWTRFVSDLGGRTLDIRGLPIPMVRLAGEVEGMLRGVTVHTVMAPYTCERCHSEAELEMAPAQVLMADPGRCPSCGGGLRFSGVSQDYETLLEVLAEE